MHRGSFHGRSESRRLDDEDVALNPIDDAFGRAADHRTRQQSSRHGSDNQHVKGLGTSEVRQDIARLAFADEAPRDRHVIPLCKLPHRPFYLGGERSGARDRKGQPYRLHEHVGAGAEGRRVSVRQ
ncbi:MAG TPA: hypothetical protein VHK24_01245, partial [Steroidobacter sp.]|nr:hypothetical protein [Steroidobacter sp.]